MAHINQLTPLVNFLTGCSFVEDQAPWGAFGHFFAVNGELFYVTLGAGGLVHAWCGRDHVNEHAPHCREFDLVHPPVELIFRKSHVVYESLDEFIVFLDVWLTLDTDRWFVA